MKIKLNELVEKASNDQKILMKCLENKTFVEYITDNTELFAKIIVSKSYQNLIQENTLLSEVGSRVIKSLTGIVNNILKGTATKAQAKEFVYQLTNPSHREVVAGLMKNLPLSEKHKLINLMPKEVKYSFIDDVYANATKIAPRTRNTVVNKVVKALPNTGGPGIPVGDIQSKAGIIIPDVVDASSKAIVPVGSNAISTTASATGAGAGASAGASSSIRGKIAAILTGSGITAGTAWKILGGEDDKTEKAIEIEQQMKESGVVVNSVSDAATIMTDVTKEGKENVLDETQSSESGPLSKIFEWIMELITTAGNKALDFIQKRDDDGNIIQGDAGGISVARTTGLALFAGLICLGIYKIIKWLGEDETEELEENVQTLNYRFKILNNKMIESKKFINVISSNYLKENTNAGNTIIEKAVEIGPAVSRYALKAEKNKNIEDISLIRKIGYFVLGGVAGVAALMLYVNWGKTVYQVGPVKVEVDQ